MTISPRDWGPPGWATIRHAWTGWDSQQPDHLLADFVRAYARVLPCASCRTNFAKTLAKFPPEDYVGSAAARAEWYRLVRAEVRKHEDKRPVLTKRLGDSAAIIPVVLILLGTAIGVVLLLVLLRRRGK